MYSGISNTKDSCVILAHFYSKKTFLVCLAWKTNAGEKLPARMLARMLPIVS